jgi:hypothetical protein
MILRNIDARGCSFKEAFLPFCTYQKADFRDCDWCDITIQLGSFKALGAKFSPEFVKVLLFVTVNLGTASSAKVKVFVVIVPPVAVMMSFAKQDIFAILITLPFSGK